MINVELTREEIFDLTNLLSGILFRPMNPNILKYTYFFQEKSLSNVEESYILTKESFERLVNLRVKLELSIFTKQNSSK
jgi:hypothetical protein